MIFPLKTAPLSPRSYGDPVAWEAFFVALGVRPLRPVGPVATRATKIGATRPEATKLPQAGGILMGFI